MCVYVGVEQSAGSAGGAGSQAAGEAGAVLSAGDWTERQQRQTADCRAEDRDAGDPGQGQCHCSTFLLCHHDFILEMFHACCVY